ncbi:MAG: sigma-70 family RNA polymerase sigma factor [Clostridia bacterium]|nr:sigma-70 family RNA polymerase sigma factor [Clostridia bacterium]
MGTIQAPDQPPLETLDRMVRQYEKDLLRICCVYLRDRNAAEDAVQETFLKAYRHLDSFRGQSSEKTWLIQIALNQCRDMRRSAWYRYMDPRVSLENLPLSSPPPSAEHMALQTAIMKLKPKYMEVVLLYFYEGLRMKEIASLLHISEAAVSIRINKAKQKLKAELEGGEDHA